MTEKTEAPPAGPDYHLVVVPDDDTPVLHSFPTEQAFLEFISTKLEATLRGVKMKMFAFHGTALEYQQEPKAVFEVGTAGGMRELRVPLPMGAVSA